MTKLLLDVEPLVILPELAQAIGLSEAIVLQQLHYWIENNRKLDRNHHDGHYWTYNTYQDWLKQFPWWCKRTLKSIIARLRNKGLVVVGNYNKVKYDRTLWYRIDHTALSLVVSGIGGAKVASSIVQKLHHESQQGRAGDASKKARSFREFKEDRNSAFSSCAEENHKRIQELQEVEIKGNA